jgi:hypothetical protein
VMSHQPEDKDILWQIRLCLPLNADHRSRIVFHCHSDYSLLIARH